MPELSLPQCAGDSSYPLAVPRPPELDLHGHTVEQALAHFTRAYNAARASGHGTRLVVIHGWNESAFKGSIADMLHRMLRKRGLKFDHPYQGNIGRTAVRIGAEIPVPGAQAAAKLRRGVKPSPKRKLSGGL